MLVLIVGLAVFLLGHSVRIVAPGWREAMMARYGENAWKGVYSLVSLVGLVLIVWGYGLSRLDPIVLYSPPVWARHLTLVLMMPVFVMLAAAYIPGRIKSTLKHPMLAAVKLWAVAHLIANGTLADVLLFGSFLVWAIVDRISGKSRPQVPAVSDLSPPAANDIIALVIGATFYVLFLLVLHQWLFGVSPLG
jgi:uncharacterized membrane protein